MHPIPPDVENEETTPLIESKGTTPYIYLVACISAIGGFLFGYDTGIISGAMIFIREHFNLDEWWQESVVSSTLLTAWIFSIMSGFFNDQFGRKLVILGSSILFVIGSLLMALAADRILLLIGRMVVGGGVGLASMTIPMYIAEVAPSNIRGQLVMINMICITGGQFFASVIAYGFSFLEGSKSWRLMLGFAAIPAAIQFFAFLAMPESPRWLVKNGRYDEGRLALRKIRGKNADTDAEFEAIRDNYVRVKFDHESGENFDQTTFRRILSTQPVRKALIVGCLLQLVQQGAGINTVMYYSASIFEMSGVYSKQKALLMSSLTAFINFAFTLVGFVLVERAGRRRLTLVSLAGVTLSLVILGVGFQFAYYNSPKVTDSVDSPINSPCNTLNECSACSRNPTCGFCFTDGTGSSLVSEATCLRVNASNHDRSVLGACISGSENGNIWAYEWCPSAYSWVTLIGMCLYLFFFAPGMGPMPWTINSEIYPSWARSWCLSASTSVNWLSNLFVAMTFLSLTRAITKQGAFYLYASIALIGLLFFVFVLPETRGKSLEELEEVFASEHWHRNKRRTEQKQVA